MINFIGIGAQKCASSWIYEVLKNSSESSLSETKEIDFFSYYFDKGYEWYHSNFDTHNKVVVGEVSPSYFYNADVPRRVFDYNSNMKIIVSLRDPVKRMYSNHLHEVRAQNITGQNLKFENAFLNNPLYLEQSLYSVHLKRWLKYFDVANIHVVFQEEVKQNPQKVSDDLCDFLGIERLPLLETFAVNASTGNRNEITGFAFKLGGDVLRFFKLKSLLMRLKNSGFLGKVYKQNKVHFAEIVDPISDEFLDTLQGLLSESDEELKNILKLSKLPWEKK